MFAPKNTYVVVVLSKVNAPLNTAERTFTDDEFHQGKHLRWTEEIYDKTDSADLLPAQRASGDYVVGRAELFVRQDANVCHWVGGFFRLPSGHPAWLSAG